MNICIPIDDDNGLDSQICLHFSKAPMLIVVNTQSLTAEAFPNSAPLAETDAEVCLKLAREKGVEAVVVGGIGLEALSELQSADLSVYSSTKDTVREIVDEILSGDINPVTLGHSCKQGGRSFGGGRGFGGGGCGGSGCGC